VASALLVAVIVIPPPGEFGATYVAVVAPCALNVPLLAVHVTPAPPASFATVAVNASDCPTANPVTFGEMVTPIPDGGGPPEVIVIVADADFVPSLTDVAVSVTVAGFGAAAAAVYAIAVPDALVVADSDPHPPAVAQDAAHVTPFAAPSLLTVAVKLCVALVATDAVVGVTVTDTPVAPPPPSPTPELDPPPHPPKIAVPASDIATAKNIRPTRCERTRITSLLQ
ncbi:MAG TPA: hypothetical protein VHP80_03555, partial [Candidatus Acidoferrum sp.]|nr:hypothetical protein [Candidatus Acidoferrum sp.]